MTARDIVIGYDDGDRTVTVDAERTEWDRDGTCKAYADGEQVAEVPDAAFAVAADQYGGA